MSWHSVTLAVWALLALATVVMAVLAARGLRGLGRPLLLLRARLCGPGGRAARVALVVGWMWLGWHFFAR